MKVLGRWVLWLVLLTTTVWGGAALWFDGSAYRPVASLLAATYTSACLALLVRVRPMRRAYASVLILFSVLLGWWFSLEPSNSRDWQPDVAQLATADIQGNKLTVRNVRNFQYRSETDFTERWETRSYDLARLRGLDLYMDYWGSPSIAHTILSWDFGNGQHLAVSIETRKTRGQSYSAVRGFFRQYELYYVLADERDVVRLRTNYRHENVYLYRLRTPPARAQAILLDYVKAVNRLAREPAWYNALAQNCTTTIRLHVADVMTGVPYDWRILANGYLDELLYEMGVVNRDYPFAELKQRSYINPRAQAVASDGDYSREIRKGLPPRPAPPPSDALTKAKERTVP